MEDEGEEGREWEGRRQGKQCSNSVMMSATNRLICTVMIPLPSEVIVKMLAEGLDLRLLKEGGGRERKM